MSDTPITFDSPKILSIQERRKRNEELKQKSEARLKAKGAPFFGASEADILDMKIQIPQMAQSINSVVKDVHKLSEDISKLSDAIQEQKMINQSLRNLLVQKQIIQASDVSDSVEAYQLSKLGLKIKEGVQEIEDGDHVLFKFKIYHEGQLIDDQTSSLMAYGVGSNQIAIDPFLIGMKEKESKTFSIISQFKNPKLMDYFGKTVEIEVFISKILQKV